MEANEILSLRTLGYGLAETSEKSDGASMSVETARELGRLILGMISDNQRMANVVLLYRQMRNDFALLEESKAVACSNYEGLKAERDSLRHKLGIADVSLESLLKERQSLIAERDSCLREIDGMRKALAVGDSAVLELRKVKEERDSLQTDLKAAVCARDHNRECIKRLVEERSGLRRELDELNAASNRVIAERDALREMTGKPLFQFAIELDRANQKAAQALGGGVA